MSRTGINTLLIYKLSTTEIVTKACFQSCAVRLCCKKFVADMCKSYYGKDANDTYHYEYVEFLGNQYHGIQAPWIPLKQLLLNEYVVYNRGTVVMLSDNHRLIVDSRVRVSHDDDDWEVVINDEIGYYEVRLNTQNPIITIIPGPFLYGEQYDVYLQIKEPYTAMNIFNQVIKIVS